MFSTICVYCAAYWVAFQIEATPIEITPVISGLINHQAALGLGMQKLTIELGHLDVFKTSI